ncbi:glutathione binding-like protein [Reyranella soli]|uniref:Glutathione S-transferase n=1 Tax=Reyranella soli TaxID=1230389 RepID=A0A512NQ91_9HYPH|nr:glutathione binding-like protein [Reyranella soli]GEP61113.1 glutathione S-transferase [Reyranella soli]
MELFASPMACSLASHITALEAGLPVKVRFVENKKTDDGGDYFQISAKGYVPALKLDDGQILNEGPSVLQYLADRKPEAGLAPAWGTVERYQLIDTLNYLSTELHKRIFYNVFNPKAADVTKQAARELFEPTFDYLSKKLGTGDCLVGNTFTVADAYLVTMLNWAVFLKIDLSKWPTIAAYHQKHLKRPSVVQAMGVEMAERQRRAA